MRLGFSRYSSSVRMAREADVCGVIPVEVNEAAARPVVWWEALNAVDLVE